MSAYVQPGVLNTSQRKRMTNLVHFYRMKHLNGSLSEPGARNYLRSALDYHNRLSIFYENFDSTIYTLAANMR